MTRNDLLGTNMKVIRDVVNQVAPLSPDASLVLVTNPSDVMAQVALEESEFSSEKIIGLGGVLDSARFRTFLAEKIGVSYKDITAFVLGGHGDDMVPLVRYSYAGGIPVDTLLDEETLDDIVHRTRFGGGEIVDLLKTGSAYFAPASSIVTMIQAVLQDEKRILPVSAYVEGEYNMKGLFVGVPVILGENGVEKILEISLTEGEQEGLEKSAEAVQSIINKL